MYAVVTQTMWLTPFNSPTMGGQRGTEDHLVERSQEGIVIISPTKTRMIDRLSGEALGVGMRAVGLDGPQLLEWTCSSLVE